MCQELYWYCVHQEIYWYCVHQELYWYCVCQELYWNCVYQELGLLVLCALGTRLVFTASKYSYEQAVFLGPCLYCSLRADMVLGPCVCEGVHQVGFCTAHITTEHPTKDVHSLSTM